MLIYDNDLTNQILGNVSAALNRPRFELMEALGTYLVFGGDTLIEFLHSLEEFPDRARLVISDFDLPELDLGD